MAQTTMLGKDLIDNPQMWQLVLEVSPRALAVIAFSRYEDHALIFDNMPLDAAAPTALRAIEDAIYDNPMLLLDFKHVTIIYDTMRFLPVPIPATAVAEEMVRHVFSENDAAHGDILVNELPALSSAIAFEVPSDILGFLRRTFHAPRITVPLAPLATYFQSKYQTRCNGKTLVNFNGQRLDIVTLGDTAPLLLNSYNFIEPLDAVYYILASRQKLSLLDTDEIMIAGDRTTRAAVTPILRRYVRYVMPAIFPSVMFRAGKASLAAPFEMIIAPLADIR